MRISTITLWNSLLSTAVLAVFTTRLQNSRIFCVGLSNKCARSFERKVWNECENGEWNWGETLKNVILASHPTTLRACELARFPREDPRFQGQFALRALRPAIKRKNDCFAAIFTRGFPERGITVLLECSTPVQINYVNFHLLQSIYLFLFSNIFYPASTSI